MVGGGLIYRNIETRALGYILAQDMYNAHPPRHLLTVANLFERIEPNIYEIGIVQRQLRL